MDLLEIISLAVLVRGGLGVCGMHNAFIGALFTLGRRGLHCLFMHRIPWTGAFVGTVALSGQNPGKEKNFLGGWNVEYSLYYCFGSIADLDINIKKG